MAVDIKMLLEDVKFPLAWGDLDYKMFIFDADGEMIADTDGYKKGHTALDCLIGDLKECPTSSHPTFRAYQGDIFDVFTNAGEPVGRVRGWGKLQYKDNPEERQDNVLNYLINVLNNQGR